MDRLLAALVLVIASSEGSQNPCLNSPDGHFAIRDVFGYLVCRDQVASFLSCSAGMVFDASQKTCVSGKSLSLDVFCKNRIVGNWRDPWNCHNFIACVDYIPYERKCFGSLVYDPETDQCQYATKIECKQLTDSDAKPTVGDKVRDIDPCAGLADGSYPLRDVFQYMLCSANKASYIKCDQGQIYNPAVSACVEAEKIALTHKKPQYPPTELNHVKSKSADPCQGRPDGKYAIPDVFRYLVCKGGSSQILNCTKDYIFVPGDGVCVPASTVDKNNFCVGRANGDWKNPWNCSTFFKCSEEVTYNFVCQFIPLVFNPYNDQCVFPYEYNCYQVPSTTVSMIAPERKSANVDPCTGLADGLYPVRDVFKYMSCKGQKSTLLQCDDGFIFDPANNACVSAKGITVETFCVGRSTGNWRNPWNCHGYLACNGFVTFPMLCQTSDLVYNPDLDQCVRPWEYKCLQLVQTKLGGLVSDDRCAKLPDGFYPLSDVIAYLSCQKGQSTIVQCKDGFIYSPKAQLCVNSTSVSVESFCKDRTDGNWRNPWNCHQFITCVHSSSVVRDCATKELVYDPYNDICEYSSIFPCKEITKQHQTHITIGNEVKAPSADPCQGRPDGKYAIPDVFRYLVCKGGSSQILNCTKDYIFAPDKGVCVPAFIVNQTNFCVGRANGDWKNPWNCNYFFKCWQEISYNFPCQFMPLVFNPYKDQCVYPNEYDCYQVPNTTVSMIAPERKSANVDPCTGLADGLYPVPDVFKYMSCKEQKSTLLQCDNGFIFDPASNACLSAKGITVETFCVGRSTGNWRNPWNCHGYLACNGFVTFPMLCQAPELVYNPDLDQCVRPWEYTCVQLVQSKLMNRVSDDRCAKLPDGFYPLRDVVAYLNCQKGQSTIVQCKDGFIYSPKAQLCINSTSVSVDSFCKDRTDGNWRNPWNCHQFITCVHSSSVVRDCATKELVYDPYNDTCEYSSLFPCREIKRKILVVSSGDNVCEKLSDGEYPVRDVFKYLTCKDHAATYHNCSTGQFYDPGQSKCVPPAGFTVENFCKDRTFCDSNWRNPWNCHQFIACISGVSVPLNCSKRGDLVYDPDYDLCQYPEDFPCVQLEAVVKAELSADPCTDKADGKYATRNVFQYLLCKDRLASYVACGPGMIFDPVTAACVDGKSVSLDNFCNGREFGDWQNPWNCHHYITCVGDQTFDRPCSHNATLNFNPDLDLCQFPFQYPCKQLASEAAVDTDVAADPCTGRVDGAYATPNVFQFLLCRRQRGTIVPCKPGRIFDAVSGNCVDGKSISIDKFCQQRDDGDWQNPWNCHNYIACAGGRSFDRPCSRNVTLNFNPDLDQCQFPFQYPCKQLTSAVLKEVLAEEDEYRSV